MSSIYVLAVCCKQTESISMQFLQLEWSAGICCTGLLWWMGCCWEHFRLDVDVGDIPPVARLTDADEAARDRKY